MTSLPQNQPKPKHKRDYEILLDPDWKEQLIAKYGDDIDLTYWVMQRNRAKTRQADEQGQRRNRSTSTGKPSAKRNYAAAVLSSATEQRLTVYGAMAEQVERVNGGGDGDS